MESIVPMLPVRSDQILGNRLSEKAKSRWCSTEDHRMQKETKRIGATINVVYQLQKKTVRIGVAFLALVN
jgi:hypothetical protein